MTDQQQAPSPDPDGEAPDRPLTLAVLRHLVRKDWKDLSGDTLVVLSRDVEGNLFSPFSTYSFSRYAPTHSELVGDVFPLPEELKEDKSLRELYADGIPDTAAPVGRPRPQAPSSPFSRGLSWPRSSRKRRLTAMSAPPQTPREGPQAPVLVISDSTDDDPVGLRACPVPLLHLPSPLFSTEEYRSAPLVILDDRSYTDFTLHHVPHRPGLIVVLADPDDATVYPRAAAIGAGAVIRAGENLNWLHLLLHDATGCRYAHWEALLAGGPADPPPPASS